MGALLSLPEAEAEADRLGVAPEYYLTVPLGFCGVESLHVGVLTRWLKPEYRSLNPNCLI